MAKTKLKKSNFDLHRAMRTLETMHTRCGYKAVMRSYTLPKNLKDTEVRVAVWVDPNQPIEIIYKPNGQNFGAHVPEYDLMMNENE